MTDPLNVKGLVEQLCEPYFIKDDDFCRTPDAVLNSHSIMRMEREKASAVIKAQATALEQLQAENERRDEILRERLFILSDRLRASGALNDDAVHAAYEQVVALLQPKEQQPIPQNGGDHG